MTPMDTSEDVPKVTKAPQTALEEGDRTNEKELELSDNSPPATPEVRGHENQKEPEVSDDGPADDPPKYSADSHTAKTKAAQTQTDHELQTGPTEYMKLSAQALSSRKRDGFRAAIFAWLTLAGYVVLPAAFTTIESSHDLGKNPAGKFLQTSIRNVDLIIGSTLGIVLFVVGTVGTCRLWYLYRKRYLWLVNKLFL